MVVIFIVSFYFFFFYRVPPQPLSTKILKFTVRISLLSAIIYAGYKILPLPSVEGLLKVSGNK